jgi:hypothetical protein
MTETKTTGGAQNGSQMRITKDERDLIKAVFKGNDALLSIVRKIFLPEIDPKAPVGQIIDLWLPLKLEGSLEDKIIAIEARNKLIMHVEQCLMQLKLISELSEQTPEQVVAKVKANSSK